MIAKNILVLATAALAAAAPRRHKRCSPDVVPQLPVNDDFPQLDPPTEGLVLKRIALGYGIQNYTCADTTADAKATGAVAGLFDVTSLYPGMSARSLSRDEFDDLTARVIETADANIPLNLVTDLEDRVPASNPGADATSPFLAPEPLPVEGLAAPLPPTGQHFFDSDGVPTFVLDGGLGIKCAKLAAEEAPLDAPAGNDNVGAVGWLRLGAKEGTEGQGTEGLEMVYRVMTAAGKSHGCKEGGGSDSSFYTALYWFYGKA